MSRKESYIQTRLDTDVRKRFDALAKAEKRKPADFLRLLIEERVDAAKKDGKRSLAAVGR